MYALGDFLDPNVIGASSPGRLPLGFGGIDTLSRSRWVLCHWTGSVLRFAGLGRAKQSLDSNFTPPPAPPNPVYPSDGTLHAPSSFSLRWNDGLDSSRRRLQWPVTYAIYYKAWNYGAPEPASYFFFGSGFQCNADSSGACTLSVSNVAAGNYRWYVVANMDVSISTGVPIRSIEHAEHGGIFHHRVSTHRNDPTAASAHSGLPRDGLRTCPSNFPVRWNDGLDPSRRNPQCQTTYALLLQILAFWRG